ncbi:hypothetical protein Q7P35_009066 [Cladosporium inversicolor]
MPTSLLDLISIDLVLRQTAPYLSIPALLSLLATNKSFRTLINTNAEAWRHLDLSKVKSATIDTSPIDAGGISWRAERMDEALTEDDFYSGPLRGILSKLNTKGVLRFVHTLILDGLPVPADLVREIIAEDRFNDSPKLRALYVFGHKDSPPLPRSTAETANATAQVPRGVLASEGAQIGSEWNSRSSATLNESFPSDDQQRWYDRSGRAPTRTTSAWADTIQACQNIIAFDALLCRGPRHDITLTPGKDFLPPAIAGVALGPQGCETCGTCPEGPAVFGRSDETSLPLLAPPPIHSSTVRAAQRPDTNNGISPPLIARCEDCLRGRWCERCNRWWCENCYAEPASRTADAPPPSTPLLPASLLPQVHVQSVEWAGPAASGPVASQGAPIKVYSKLCVEHCLVGEMMMSADGFWGWASTGTASAVVGRAKSARGSTFGRVGSAERSTVSLTMKVLRRLSAIGAIKAAFGVKKYFVKSWSN